MSTPDDLLDITGAIVDGFSGDNDEYIVTGQGCELLTWKQAQSDFAPQLGFDSSEPGMSLWNVVEAVPHSFALPIAIGGSSEQQTAVRVDRVDVVRLGIGESIGLSGPENEWYSYQGPEGSDNNNGKRYEVTQADIPFDDVVVYVWITVQKYSHGTPSGTCFAQREQQLVIFKPHSQYMAGYNASGDLYCNPSLVAP